MKGKLLIICEEGKVDTAKMAEYVYEYLGQKDELFAELIFVDEEEIQRLNKEYRQVDKVTDVLSFPNLDGIKGKVLRCKDYPSDVDEGRLFIGSIAICEKKAKEQAEEYGHSYEREINYLTLHGLLHLFGYDHMEEEDKKEMRSAEEAILKKMGLEIKE